MTELRQRMIQDMKIRNYSPKTIEAYTRHLACFARHFGRSPDQLGPEEIRQYQVYLVEQKKASWSAFNQAVCALRFLYGTTLRRNWPVTMIPFGKKPKTLPAVLGPEEVQRLLACVYPLKQRVILTVLYAAGLRLDEALHLEVSDIDAARMLLRVARGKGAKERLVPLSPRLLECLRDYWRKQRPKTWLFPGTDPQRPLNPSAVQGVCRRAATEAGLWGWPIVVRSTTGCSAWPVKALSRLFRGKFLDGLKRLHAQGRLKLEGKLAHLADREAFQRWLTPLYQKEWVVFCEAAPNGCDGPDAVLKYLACYVAGAAISDKRLISHEGGRVTFWARDRSKKGKGKKRRPHRLDGEEFVRRYLMHVLPRGFQRVRYYGLFSHRQRATQEQVRAALQGVDAVGTAAEPAVPEASEAEQPLAKTCSACGQGTLQARVSAETPLSWFDVLMASPYATAADRAWWEDCPCRARPPTSGPLTEAVR